MDPNLKKIAEEISCNRINFIDKKYNFYNDNLFNVNVNDNDNDRNKKNKINHTLDSLYINKKSCIMSSTEPDEGLWKKQFELINFKNNNLFNINTRAKN